MHKFFVLMLFKSADQTAGMRRLVSAFVVHKLTEDRVSRVTPKFYTLSWVWSYKGKEITMLWDWTLPGLGRISILCLQVRKRIEENLTISDNWLCVLVSIYKMVWILTALNVTSGFE